MTRQVQIYDTTLRDGTQAENFNLSLNDKIKISQKLDDLGIDFIEDNCRVFCMVVRHCLSSQRWHPIF